MPTPPRLLLNSVPIEIVSSFKTLGVIFTENVSWNNHVSYIASQLSKIVGLTSHHRFVLPTKVKLLIYNSLFYSHLNYGHLAWGTTTLKNQEKLYLLQKKMARMICSTSYFSHTETLFQKLSLIKISDLYNYKLSAHLVKVNRRNTTFLTDLADLRKNNPVRLTRHAAHYSTITFKSGYELGLQTLQHLIPTLLNNFIGQNIDIYNLTAHEHLLHTPP